MAHGRSHRGHARGPDRPARRRPARSTTRPPPRSWPDFIGDMNHLEGTLRARRRPARGRRGRRRASGSAASSRDAAPGDARAGRHPPRGAARQHARRGRIRPPRAPSWSSATTCRSSRACPAAPEVVALPAPGGRRRRRGARARRAALARLEPRARAPAGAGGRRPDLRGPARRAARGPHLSTPRKGLPHAWQIDPTSSASWSTSRGAPSSSAAITRRQALLAGAGGAMAAYLGRLRRQHGRVGRRRRRATARRRRPRRSDAQGRAGRPAAGQLGRLLRPGQLQGLHRRVRPEGHHVGLRLQRRAAGQAPRRRLQVRHRRADGLRGEDDDRPGPRAEAQPRPDPEPRNLSAAFTKTEYDPGNQYSVPKDYGITSFYWLHGQGEGAADDDRASPSSSSRRPTPRGLKVNFLEGGTQVVGMALKALGYSLNSEDEQRARRGPAAPDRRQAERGHDHLDVHRARQQGQIDFGMGWNGDIRRAIVGAGREGPRDGLPRARRTRRSTGWTTG